MRTKTGCTPRPTGSLCRPNENHYTKTHTLFDFVTDGNRIFKAEKFSFTKEIVYIADADINLLMTDAPCPYSEIKVILDSHIQRGCVN